MYHNLYETGTLYIVRPYLTGVGLSYIYTTSLIILKCSYYVWFCVHIYDRIEKKDSCFFFF